MTYWFVTLKDLKIQFKDIPGMIFLFLTPVIVIAVASFALSGLWNTNYNKFQVPLVQLDKGVYAQQFVKHLQKVSAIELLTTYQDQNGTTHAMTLAQARTRIPDLKAAIVIPADFSANIQNKKAANITVLADPADRIVPSAVNDIVKDGVNQLLGTTSLVGVVQTVSAPDANYHKPTPFESNVPGYAVMFVLFSTSFAAASLLAEKEAGTLRKLKSLPISRFSILGGKMLANFLLASYNACCYSPLGILSLGCG